MERDSVDFFLVRLDFDFNSHAHVERDFLYAPFFAVLCNFNSHAHVERDTFVGAQCPLEINFNSHAHVERDVRRTYRINSPDISTHTLTWSVTVTASQPLDVVLEFQLTRSRGA